MSRHYHSLLRRYLVCNLLFVFLAGCPVNERTERMQSETINTELTCEMGYVEMVGECVPDVDRDEDRDGVPDTYDNCPAIVNAHQRDCDLDGIGDDCDEDYPCGATLVGEVTTVTDLNVGVINFSGGLIRLLPSGNVTEIDEIGFYRMPISVGEHTVQVFDPVDILRAQLDVGEAPDDGAESPENMDENQDNPPPENAASDSDANETNADDLTIPVGVEPVAEKDIEITLFDMNQQVTLNVLVGGIGRLVGVICLSDRNTKWMEEKSWDLHGVMLCPDHVKLHKRHAYSDLQGCHPRPVLDCRNVGQLAQLCPLRGPCMVDCAQLAFWSFAAVVA